ncbi:MAG: hypothetical protein QHC90_17840 [Shinella sp.]|nr:hypothetical protein [Shinella sp.]
MDKQSNSTTVPAVSTGTKQALSPNLTRRKALGLLAAASVPPTAVVAAAAATPTAVAANVCQGVSENPELLAAYERFKAARAEVAAAKDALEWLADEWRHVWPLAPEEILDGANAHQNGRGETAERDIAGRFVMRDTNVLKKRLTAKFRAENDKTCFSVISTDQASETVSTWAQQTPAGRTEKALARNRVYRDEAIQRWQRKLELAREYEAETARLRAASGVEKAKSRIEIAESEFRMACVDISRAQAITGEGLRIKAEAIKSHSLVGIVQLQSGILGDMARFIDNALNVIGRA